MICGGQALSSGFDGCVNGTVNGAHVMVATVVVRRLDVGLSCGVNGGRGGLCQFIDDRARLLSLAVTSSDITCG